MTQKIYSATTRELAEKRRTLAPETEKAFRAFSRLCTNPQGRPVRLRRASSDRMTSAGVSGVVSVDDWSGDSEGGCRE